MKKISIIIPVYNSSKYLKTCLDSIRQQTFSNWEAICIDDGSTDESYAILKNYSEQDSRFRVYRQKNAGQSSARNFGLTLVRGDYISFVDSDDFIEPEFLKHLYENMENNSAQISISGVAYYNENGKKISQSSSKRKIMHFDEFMRELFRKRLFQEYLCDKLFCASMFDGITLPLNSYYEDSAVMASLFEKASTIVYDGRVCYCYRMHASSSIHSSFSQKKKNLIAYRLNNVRLSEKFDHAFDLETKTALLSAIHFTYLEILNTDEYLKWIPFALKNEQYIPKDIPVLGNGLIKLFDKPFVFCVQKFGFCPKILIIQNFIKRIVKTIVGSINL